MEHIWNGLFGKRMKDTITHLEICADIILEAIADEQTRDF